ncbi:cytochrome B561, N terminal-domain-containing protein [Globomyces pollinis-pini]|nr:cytochrome B561, N terminal-domain-containing protein [Globomyces pollinis-pini]
MSISKLFLIRANSVLRESHINLLQQSIILIIAATVVLYFAHHSNYIWSAWIILVSIALSNILSIAWLFFYPPPKDQITVQKPPIAPKTPTRLLNTVNYDQSPYQYSPNIKQVRNLFLRSSPMSPKIKSSPNTIRFNNLRENENLYPNANTVELNHLTAPITLPHQFLSSIKPTQSPVRKEIVEQGFKFTSAEQTIQNYKAEMFINSWSENMRKWLSKHVLQKLSDRITSVDELFNQNQLGHLTCELATYVESPNTTANAATTTTNPFGGFGSTNTGFGGQQNTQQKFSTLNDLKNAHGKEPYVIERLAIDRYLTIKDFNCRSYIVHRIKKLAQGPCLINFKWNSGEAPKDSSWSDQFPSDALLVMTLFCRFMDEKFPCEGFGPDPYHPFTNNYFLDSLKPRQMSRIRIRQSTKSPPHFQLLVDNNILDVAMGRNNLFDTLSLFVYHIKIKDGGYLGLLNLGGKAIDLLSILMSK